MTSIGLRGGSKRGTSGVGRAAPRATRTWSRATRPHGIGAVLLLLSACSNGSKSADEAGIGVALLRTLTSAGQPICVDSGTFGQPLAVFRTMLPAPESVRRLLHWSVPGPLRPGRTLTGRELVNGELRDDPSTLPDFEQSGAHLSVIAETQLDALARMSSLVEPEEGVRLHAVPEAPLASVRWWPVNWLDPHCTVTYTVSKPVIKQTIAFVTVTAAHRGTTYAFQKEPTGSWQTIAKWSDWLY